MKNHTFQRILIGMACLLPLSAAANSYVYNDTDNHVDVVWKAAGCAGVKKTVDLGCKKTIRPAIETVCKKKTLAPGEGHGYKFNWGTSGRSVQAFTCIKGSDERASGSSGNKGNKSRCAARIRSDGEFGLHCGYSKEEFQELKNH